MVGYNLVTNKRILFRDPGAPPGTNQWLDIAEACIHRIVGGKIVSTSDIKFSFVEPPNWHIGKIRNVLAVDYIGLRVKLHEREPCRIDRRVNRPIEHVRWDFVTVHTVWLDASRACRKSVRAIALKRGERKRTVDVAKTIGIKSPIEGCQDGLSRRVRAIVPGQHSLRWY